jgi:hypothetical protein
MNHENKRGTVSVRTVVVSVKKFLLFKVYTPRMERDSTLTLKAFTPADIYLFCLFENGDNLSGITWEPFTQGITVASMK